MPLRVGRELVDLREEELSLATYLDDNAKISTERYADIAHARFLALATKCGLECEPSKDRPPSSVEQLYLGCLLHIEAQQLRVPPERVEDGVAVDLARWEATPAGGQAGYASFWSKCFHSGAAVRIRSDDGGKVLAVYDPATGLEFP